MDTYSAIPRELEKRIKNFFKYFIGIHQTEATKNVAVKVKREHTIFKSIGTILNIFNYNINWYRTKEGYAYYYALNMRWVIGVSYLCHEMCPELDNICKQYLDKFLTYSNTRINSLEKDRYNRKKNIYSEKVKIIKEIFGN